MIIFVLRNNLRSECVAQHSLIVPALRSTEQSLTKLYKFLKNSLLCSFRCILPRHRDGSIDHLHDKPSIILITVQDLSTVPGFSLDVGLDLDAAVVDQVCCLVLTSVYVYDHLSHLGRVAGSWSLRVVTC